MNDLVKAGDAVADRRRVLEWRDTHLIRARLALSDGWMELRPQLAERIAALPLPQLLLRPTAVTGELLAVAGERFGTIARATLRDA